MQNFIHKAHVHTGISCILENPQPHKDELLISLSSSVVPYLLSFQPPSHFFYSLINTLPLLLPPITHKRNNNNTSYDNKVKAQNLMNKVSQQIIILLP